MYIKLKTCDHDVFLSTDKFIGRRRANDIVIVFFLLDKDHKAENLQKRVFVFIISKVCIFFFSKKTHYFADNFHILISFDYEALLYSLSNVTR